MITIETSRTPKPKDGTESDVLAPPSRTHSRMTDSVIIEDDRSSLGFFADDMDLPDFVPKIGIFGAPMCRLTTSVITLIGMMVGMVMFVSGLCILLLFTQEPTITPLGITLTTIGSTMLFFGLIMWMSEFMCSDCLAKVYYKAKKAPLKQAIKRREKMASRATNRTGSRLSASSIRTNTTAVSNTLKGEPIEQRF